MLPGVGIFGTGDFVNIIAPFLISKEFTIKAIWGKTLQKAEKAAKLLNINYYTNKIDDVLLRKDVELVLVMCSPHLQAQISVKALSIGKHVVCDKPAGLNQTEAIRMVHASQYYPSLIAIVNHSLRFLPAFYHMKQVISNGFLGSKDDITVCDIRVQMGPLYFDKYNWLCEELMGGGVVALVGSHVIDLITYLICQKAVRVHAIIKNFTETTECINGIRRITSPDYCTFQMHMNKNTLVNITINTNLPCTYSHEILICGKKGYLVVRGSDLYGFQKGSSEEEVIYLDADDSQFESYKNLLSTSKTIPKPFIIGLFKMIDALKESFISVEDKSGWVKEPVADASTFDDSLYVQAVIHALKLSSANRSWECVEILTEESSIINSFSASDSLIATAARFSGVSS